MLFGNLGFGRYIYPYKFIKPDIMRLPFKIKSVFLAYLVIMIPLSTALKGQSNSSLYVNELRTEYYKDPVGIDRADPRFSWIIESDRQNTHQSAWQVQVASGIQELEAGDLIWDTERVSSNVSSHNKYSGPALQSRQRYYWRVRVWDNHGNTSDWSEPAYWETGLMESGDWLAEWIAPGYKEDTEAPQPAPMLRTEFDTRGDIASARAYVTAHGLYEMHINGRRVGQELFTPGWTSYNNRLQYQTYDITRLLKTGKNAIGVYLGDGWFRGYIGWGDQRNYYGETLALLAQIEITYEDGTSRVIGTDGDWKAATGPILQSDIYNGEYYDARLEKEGWTLPGFDDSGWESVTVEDHGKDKLIGREAPPVVKIQELKPVDLFTTPEGDMVVDMGQNMIGWIKLRVRGPAGTQVKLRHAEVLDRDGNFYTENLRSADQENTYILKGEGIEVWEPRFTFQGFRYVAIEGYPGDLMLDNITGVVIHSEMEPTGHFQSSHSLVNQLQHNIIWGQKGNFLDVPTDCPQRDERMGWTGDIQVFAHTANINMNTAGFLTKWLGDLEADQNAEGSVPHVVPNVLGENAYGSAGWADASLIVPWSLYRYFGDTDILEKQYESMRSWVEYMRRRAAVNEKSYLWDVDFSFGDWLSYSTESNAHYPGAYTDYHMIATMYFARSADILRKSALVLGKNDDAEEYGTLFENIRQAFLHEYVTPGGRVMSDTQTAYLLALEFNLLPEELRAAALDRLVSDVENRGHLTTGFLGTPLLNPVLSRNGHNKTAYDLLLRESYPSWLYPVTMGATTIWERWDGIKPDGTFQSEGMNSFNHYAYGAVGEWLYEHVAGIQPLPGYRSVSITPSPGGGFSHARAIINTIRGRIESAWEIVDDRFTLFVEIPANGSAIVTLPDATLEDVGGSAADREANPGILGISQVGENVLVQVGSGKYIFTYDSEALAEKAGVEYQGPLPIFGTGNTIGELLAFKHSRDVLYRHLPELTNSPWLSQVMGFTLNQAMETLPLRYRVEKQVIADILTDLNIQIVP
jgi:alpha-L-rhamnosidase